MTKKENERDWLKESDRWDEFTLEELIDMSEPVDEAVHVQRKAARKAISLRVDQEIIDYAKEVASDIGLGYQTLLRAWLIQGVRRHRDRIRAGAGRHSGARKTPPRAARVAAR